MADFSETPSADVPSVAEAQAEQTSVPPDRDGTTGRFLPGNCANPEGGRVKQRRITDAIQAYLDREGADGLIDAVTTSAMASRKATDKLAAAAWMADRTEGKPLQAHRVEASVQESTAQQILTMLEALTGSKSSE